MFGMMVFGESYFISSQLASYVTQLWDLIFLSWSLVKLNTAVLLTNDTNSKPYSANHDTLSNPRILQSKSGQAVQSTGPPMQITTAVQSTDLQIQIKPHSSVHGSSNANQATIFSPRIFQCKSRHTLQFTGFKMHDVQQLSSLYFVLQQEYWDTVSD